jgi:transposase
VAELSALTNRLKTTGHRLVARQLRARNAMLQRHIKTLEAAIAAAVKADTALTGRFRILTSIPGIGPVAATTMIAELNELGACSRTQIAALLGVAPMNWDSGLRRGRRIIKGGRAPLRAVLYMAAVAAIRSNPDIEVFYRRLRDRGKKAKLALTAVMRKLVILANTLVKENRTWTPIAP